MISVMPSDEKIAALAPTGRDPAAQSQRKENADPRANSRCWRARSSWTPNRPSFHALLAFLEDELQPETAIENL
jgi:hypothetical protein